MPGQNNLLMDFNPTPQQGSPFAEQLTSPYQTHEASGYSGKAGDSFFLASKFLEGVQKGKIAKYQREESEIAKKRSVLGSYIEQQMNRDDLPDAAKQHIGKTWTDWLNSNIATADTGKVDKDKPQGIKGHLVNFLKDFAKSQLGGNIPKHGKIPDPEKVMMGIESELKTNPQFRSKTAQAEEEMQKMQETVKALPANSSQMEVLRATGHHLNRLGELVPDRLPGIRANLLGGYSNIESNAQRETFKLQDPANPEKFIAAERDPRNPNVYVDHTGKPLGPEYNSWIPVKSEFQTRDPALQAYYDPTSKSGGRLGTRGEARGQESMPTAVAPVLQGGQSILQPGAVRMGGTAVPPPTRTAQTQQHAINQFEKIREQKAAAWAKANTWYDNAMKAVKMKSASGLDALGIPNQGGATSWDQLAQWIEQEAGPGGKNKDGTERPLGRQQRAAQDAYMEGIGQTNQLYYPQQGTAAPPGDIDEAGYSTGGPGTSPPPATTQKLWTDERIGGLRRN